jgi:hypothetical protein
MSPAAERFAYPRLQFAVKSLALLTFLGLLLLLLNVLSDADWQWSALFAALFLAGILVVGISPMMTAHEVTGEGIRLRQGLVLSRFIAFEDIAELKRVSRSLLRLGLPLANRRQIVLAGGPRGLVLIVLKRRQRFGSLLFRSSHEILIDLIRPDEFLEAVSRALDAGFNEAKGLGR